MINFRFVITDRSKTKMMQSRITFDTQLKNPHMQEFLLLVLISLAFKPVMSFFAVVLLPAGFAEVQNLKT